MDRTILHCDLNNFFASVELLSHPELRDKPVAVCGDPESRHGIILAKNEIAKRYQVKTAETIWQARKKCPDLLLLPSHHEKYRAFSRKINAIYDRYTDIVEPFSIDESWLDITGTMHLFGKDGRGIADELRQTVQRELGLTISVGVSFNKVFAKLGSDYKKPNATTVITRENFRDILWPLPVTDMLFVGNATAKILKTYDIHTIGHLARTDRQVLERILGKQGGILSDYARGLDASKVTPAREMGPPKSVGNGMTFPANLLGEEAVRTGIELLSDSVGTRLRRHEMKCTSVQLTIRDPNFRTITRQTQLSVPTYLSREIAETAMGLARNSWDFRRPIRMLTVTGQGLISQWDAAEQMDLFAAQAPKQREKLERLEKAVDAIRGKYGKDAIGPGSLAKGERKGGDSSE